MNRARFLVGVVLNRPARRFASDTAPIAHTALYETHNALGAKMVPFCGWSMPLYYKPIEKSPLNRDLSAGVVQSHLWTRKNASLFDVSHMLQLRITGKDRIKFIEYATVGDFQELKPGSGRLSVMCDEKGGIIDDTVITKYDDHLYVVLNAACAEKDFAHLTTLAKKTGFDVKLNKIIGNSLLALQGPKAVSVLQKLTKVDLNAIKFMHGTYGNILDAKDCTITRCGYTGEDGFEISIPSSSAPKIFMELLSTESVLPAGLGVRDTLRLEAGLCLYGNDIDLNTSPVDATLRWLIAARHKAKSGPDPNDRFLGDTVILKQLKDDVPKRRIGLILDDGIPRDHCNILDKDGASIGVVTSGLFSPILNKGIAMGYVPRSHSKVGTAIQVDIRGKAKAGQITKMPFVPTKYAN